MATGQSSSEHRGEAQPAPRATAPTLKKLRSRREEILAIAAAHGASNVRIFGSVARGEADSRSDVDILVDITADADGFAYFGVLEDLRRALTAALGYDVDVFDSAGLRPLRERVLGGDVKVLESVTLARMRERVMREAVPL